MNILNFSEKLRSLNICFRENEKMCNHTSFKIGGVADVFVLPENVTQLKEIIENALIFDVPYFILGNGSNLLVSDKGIEGAVISLAKFNEISVDKNEIKCGAGLSLSKLCMTALNNELTGLEFAYGIPGSVGGAVFMNAGAYGGDVSQVITSALCLDNQGNIIEISKEEMMLGYRTSVFKTDDKIILEATFLLEKGEKDEIKAKMDELISKRKEKQPLEYPSAGSTFKRPKDNFAGTLIEKNGLKGTNCGGAEVSTKHAGFVINKGNATCDDVLSLIKKVQKTVFEGDGIMLEPEVIFVGRK